MAPQRPAQRPRVAVVGPLNVDLFMRGEAPLDRVALTEWVGPSDVDLRVAGSVGYTVQVLHRLGADVAVCSSVGDDAFGSYVRAELEGKGLDCRDLMTAPGGTAIAIYVLLFGGLKRPMTYRLPGFQPWPDPPPVLEGDRPLPALVHSGGLLHFPEMHRRGLAGVFAEARRRGVMTSLDPQFPLVPTPPPWLPSIADVLAESDILLCDEGEIGAIFDLPLREAVVAAHRAGPRLVAVKRGASGSIVSDVRSVVVQPAVTLPAEAIREAVGAGDAYDAGFLLSVLGGDEPGAAARRATAAAALSLGGRGGSEGIAGPEAVEAALARVPPSAEEPA